MSLLQARSYQLGNVTCVSCYSADHCNNTCCTYDILDVYLAAKVIFIHTQFRGILGLCNCIMRCGGVHAQLD